MSSNTNIGNTPVNQGYVQLIHMGETGGIDGTLRALYDGDGTASDLLIASDKVKISTELYIGSKTLTEFVQDTVGAMFSSNTETNITVTYQDGDGTIDLVSSGEVTLTGSETLTNKTLTSPVINTGISGSAILDEDNMASNSATKLSTQQSIKAYVDTEVAGIVSSAPSTLDTLNELAAALGDDANFSTTVTNSIATKASLTGTETLTNKTLASPTFTGDITFNDASTPQLNITDTTNTVSARVAASDTTVTFGSTTDNNVNIVRNDVGHFTLYSNYTMHNNGGNDVDFRVKDSSGNVIFKVDAANSDVDITNLDVSGDADIDGTLETDALTIGGVTSVPFEAADHSKLDGIEALADKTDTANVTSAGALMDSEVTDLDGIKSLTVPNDTTISATAKTLLDDDSTTNMRTTLGLEIGSDIQAYDAGLNSIAGLTTATNKMIYTTGSDTYATTTLSATGRSLIDDNTTADMLTTLGLTATAAELNYTDGVTSNIQTQLGTKVPTTRSITPVSQRGISGGGDLSADRTFELSSSQLSQVTLDAADNLILFDNSDSDIPKRFVAQDIFDSLGGITIDGTTANGLLTYGGTNNIDTEANLTFDGSTLALTGDLNVDNNTLFVDSSANMVGIGTNSPDRRLTVTGGAIVSGKFASTSATGHLVDMISDNATDGYNGFRFYEQTSFRMALSHIQTGTRGYMQIGRSWASGSEILVVDGDNSRVGIGTTSPETKLEVAGEIQASVAENNYAFAVQKNSTEANFRYRIYNDGSTTGEPLTFRTGLYYGTTENATMHFYRGGGSTGGYMTFQTNNGNERMRIDSSGNVGIGTTSPSASLHINTTDDGSVFLTRDGGHSYSLEHDTSQLYLYNRTISKSVLEFEHSGPVVINEQGHSTVDFRVEGDTDANLLFTDASTDRVGIGTASPGSKLHIKTPASANADLFIEATDYTPTLRMYSGGANVQPLIRFGTGSGSSKLRLQSITAGGGISGSVSDVMTLQENGNVGIGTNSPAQKLHVAGNVMISNNTFFMGEDADGDDIGLLGLHSNNNCYVGPKDNAYAGGFMLYGAASNTSGHVWYSGNAEAMRIDSSQRVGIGTNSPGYKLDVAGDARSDRLIFRTNASAPTADAAIFRPADNSVGISTNNTERVRVNSSGALHVVNDVVAFSSTPSDQKLKTNVKDIEYGLDTIMKLKPKQYDWKKDNRKDIGFIAQEVEEVIPEIVKDNEWFDDKIKTMDYEKLTAVLIKAVQQQQDQINELKGIING